VAQRHQRHELRNRVVLFDIDDARHLHLRRKVGHEQFLDPGADRANPTQARQPRRHAGGEAPAEHRFDIGPFSRLGLGLVVHKVDFGRDVPDRIGKVA